MATLIDGKAVAEKVRREAARDVALAKTKDVEAGLAVILVGDDPASAKYVGMKARDCVECGIHAFDEHLPASTSQEELLSIVDEYNHDPFVHGILVQLPLPSHLDTEEVIAHISPEKDVDGFTAANLGRLMRGLDCFECCTPAGVMRLLEEYGIDPDGKRAVVIGRSLIVGRPLATLLTNANATVTLCHSHTQGLQEICRERPRGRRGLRRGGAGRLLHHPGSRRGRSHDACAPHEERGEGCARGGRTMRHSGLAT